MIGLIFGIVLQSKTTVEMGVGFVADIYDRVDSSPETRLSPSRIDRKQLAAKIQSGFVSVVSVVFHQVYRVIIGACTVELCTTQGMFVVHPTLNDGLFVSDVGRQFLYFPSCRHIPVDRTAALPGVGKSEVTNSNSLA